MVDDHCFLYSPGVVHIFFLNDLGLEDSYWQDWPEDVVEDHHYAWINYTHQKSWFNYPMTTGLDYRLKGGLRNSVFDRAQYQLETWVRVDNRD